MLQSAKRNETTYEQQIEFKGAERTFWNLPSYINLAAYSEYFETRPWVRNAFYIVLDSVTLCKMWIEEVQKRKATVVFAPLRI